MKTAFVPLRSGSKGIPDKNIKEFCGQPLCYWVLKALHESNIDSIVVSTNSIEYQMIISKFKFDKITFAHRSDEVSNDEASTEDTILEFLDCQHINCHNDIFMLVQATNPFLTTFDINTALSLYDINSREVPYTSLVSVVEQDRMEWLNMNPNQGMKSYNFDYKNRPRRQDREGRFYIENGSFYISTTKNIIDSRCRVSGYIDGYIMPDWTQYEIDTMLDWEICELVFEKMVINREMKKLISESDTNHG